MSSGETPQVAELPNAAAGWDNIYRESGENYFFGREASPLARLALQYWKLRRGAERGPLLDLGCGEGRDAVFFAQAGFDVTALDGSEVGMEKLDALAREARVGLTAVRCDLQDYALPESLPFLHANNCLQFLGEGCLPMLYRLQGLTPSGGLHSVSVFTRESVPEREGVYRFDRNELKFLYREWFLLFYAENIVWREPMQTYLSFAQIIAQKR
jgi:tellurite methyltransferase